MISDAEALRAIDELERLGFKIDAILPSGTHRYYSTHCRHDRHADCSAIVLKGVDVQDAPAHVMRKPARCKTCAAPCVGPRHRGESQP
jgi:hypothetical protein